MNEPSQEAINFRAMIVLRDRTGLSLTKCKERLEEVNYDLEKAIKLFKSKSLVLNYQI